MSKRKHWGIAGGLTLAWVQFACQDYSCSDTATCATATEQLLPDAEVVVTTETATGGEPSETSSANPASSRTSSEPPFTGTGGDVASGDDEVIAPATDGATDTVSVSTDATMQSESSSGGSGPESSLGQVTTDVPASGASALGEPCEADEQCESGACVPGWPLQDDETLVCCREVCEGGARCSAAGECQSCEPGRRAECWEDEEGTPVSVTPELLKGDCRAGSRICNEDGEWGVCQGAVGPQPSDSCSVAGSDADCDGLANEGCACTNGETRPCGKDEGNCVAGTQTCNEGRWSVCTGEVAPLAQDSCATAGDDATCNGLVNEGCECVGGQTRSCGDCGIQSCDPVRRTWAACQRAESATTRCRAGSTTILETCTAQGTWTASTCPFVCEGGACGGVCSPGATQCVPNPERRQVCNAGAWDTVESCPSGSRCVNGGTECRKNDGGTCTSDNQCVSGACVDGICCASDCAPVSCSAYDTQCLSHPPSVTRNLCGADGRCKSAAAACAEAASAASNVTPCDFPNLAGGRCDGSGVCRPPAVVCGAQTCSLDAQVCCFRKRKEAGGYFECSTAASCANDQAGGFVDFEISCDSDVDCASDERCCDIANPGRIGIMCSASCPLAGQGSSAHPLCGSPAMSSNCTNESTCIAVQLFGELTLPGYRACEPN